MKKFAAFSLLLLSAVMPLWAKEYFVSPTGNDTAKGTKKAPFLTIQKGVDTLKPGDTLTILPGSYRGSILWRFDGAPNKITTVRAQIPGTVLLHGDREITGFKAVPGKKNCYVADLAKEPEGANECDTFVMYKKDTSVLLTPHPLYGVFFYDKAGKKLYIATSDGRDPKFHGITVSEYPASGFSVTPKKSKKVQNVVVDGIAAKGFSTKALAAHSSVWGIEIRNAEKCVIKNCASYMNEGGITLHNGKFSLISHCQAYGNGTSKHVSAGNIVVFGCTDTTIDNCISYKSVTYGIRFYGGGNNNDTISNSISLSDSRGSIWIKPDNGTNKLVQVFTPSMLACGRSYNCVYGANDYDRDGKKGPTSLVTKKHPVLFGNDFADPWNFDFRLQKNSTFKKGFAGTNVYFVSPAGKDTNDGRSIKSTWKTLKNVPDGATVYLLPGTYAGNLELNASDVTIAGRGQQAPIIIKGGTNALILKGKNPVVKRLHFNGQTDSAVLLAGKADTLTLECCVFNKQKSAVSAPAGAKVQITHNTFAPDTAAIVKGKNVSGLFAHNIAKIQPKELLCASNTSSTQMAISFDGRPFGPYFFIYEPQGGAINFVKPLPTSSTTAEIVWYANAAVNSPYVYVMDKIGKKSFRSNSFTMDSTFHSVSLDKLVPGREYSVFAGFRSKLGYTLSNLRYLPKKFNPNRVPEVRSKVFTFRTPAADRSPKTWHVALTGKDTNDGSAKSPFRTISRAALATAPGDTVIINEGLYTESVFVTCSGAPGKPITFKAAPNAEVWLEGDSRRFCRAFAAFGKKHLVFDGFRFKNYGTAFPNSSGVFMTTGGQDIRITRCFNDGRGRGYAAPLIHARNSAKVLVNNCVSMTSMAAMTFVETSDVTVTNNVFRKAAIWTLAFHSSTGKHKVLFANNIVSDNIRAKTFQAPLMLSRPECLIERNNIYYLRLPRNLRKVVEVHSPKFKQYTIDEYYKTFGTSGNSLTINPGIKIISNQLCWNTLAERARDLKKPMAFHRENNNLEEARNPKDYTQFGRWSFADFFSPEIYKKYQIGLNDALFKDVHVKALPGYDQR